MSSKKNYKDNYSDFDALKITLASPEQILEWSYGEVTKAETINYRTYRAEPDGLFCEKIFGPTRNNECYCGKYKKVRYKGIVCDKCGVEVASKDLRRVRMGHINLAVPVAHVWFAYGVPNKMSIILDMTHKKMLSVIYYTRYLVVEVEDEKRDQMAKKLEEFHKLDKETLDNELAEELKGVEDEFTKKAKDIKKSAKDDATSQFKLSQLEHKKSQSIAKVRKGFAERAEEIDAFFTKLTKLVREITVGTNLTEDEYVDLADRDLIFFEARMGAEAIEHLLKKLDIASEVDKLKYEIKQEKSKTLKMSLIRRLQFLEGLYLNKIDPAWMVLRTLPVVPPDLRPIIPLSGGKFATSDLNDLYRRIINRNNRLKRLIDIGAPDVILRNEKRMLQESVDALIDNSHRPSKPMLNNKKLPYRSLTDELRGKKGIFRRNLLGKRVDYSGRAVIVGDAKLKLHQCGLPKAVALEMFKPFVIHDLIEQELAPNIKVAKDMIEEEVDIVWDVLEKIIKDKPVLLNRAPTLHKYSIQGFYPVLVEGESIRIHPLVCNAYNADFDGDMMAVHVLLTEEAVKEGQEKMLSTKNIVSIAHGNVLALPRKDMLLGYFLLTDMDEVEHPRIFGSFEEAIKAYQLGEIKINEMIATKGKGGIHKTSVGRVLFNQILPEDYPFVNERIGKSGVERIVNDMRSKYPVERIIQLLDDLKELGFKYATELSFSFSMEDCNVALDIHSQIEEIEEKDRQLHENYQMGLSTLSEMRALSVKMWNNFSEELAQESWQSLTKNNPIYEMVTAGADGSAIQARQIISIKGLVRNSQGQWVPLPIKGNYRDGLSAFEYFVSTGGGRKGVADSALRTAQSGYLTRKLHEVSHDVIVRSEDCGYHDEGHVIRRGDQRRLSFENTIVGRVLAQDLKDDKGTVVQKKNEFISKEVAEKAEELGINEVWVRSPITCDAPYGVCKMCYGHDIERGELVEIGKAVGVIAAQSLGEPGTQMTLRSFHFGGAMKVDITEGLPRIEELLEARTPKVVAQIANLDGVVSIEKQDDGTSVVTIRGEKEVTRHYVVSLAKKVSVEDGAKVKSGQILYIDSVGQERQAAFDGVVKVDGGILTLTGTVKAEESMTILPAFDLLVQDGQELRAGTQLTTGSVDPKQLAEVAGVTKALEYIIRESQAVFNEQGVPVNDIHLETIVRQMARMGMVMESGDSGYLAGSLVSMKLAQLKNEQLRSEGKNIALVVPKLLGIKTAALKTESFLSAMSFQENVRVLTESALTGKVDYLRGMKENVIIGRKIPTGQDAVVTEDELLKELE